MNYGLLKEKVSHGNVMFPLKIHVYDTDVRLKERIGCHWHEELEFLVVTQGGADFNIDGRSYRVSAGEILFVSSNLLHSATAIQNLPYSFFAVVFSPALLMSYADDNIQQKYIDPVLNAERTFPAHIRPAAAWEKRVLSMLYEIKDIYLEKGNAYELPIKAKLYEIWYLLFSCSECSDHVSRRYNDYQVSRMKSVLNYIHKRYNRKMTLAELSGAFNLSEGQFCRFFKSMMNMTVVDYINSYRIRECGAMLKKTDKEIGEIACMAGFNNISYFNKIFRKYMHCSPSEFRVGG